MRGHRTARVGSLIEHAPVTTRPEVHLSGGNLFTLTVIRPAWAYRVELTGMALLGWLYWWLTGEVGDRRRAGVIILAATALLMLIPRSVTDWPRSCTGRICGAAGRSRAGTPTWRP
jgi:hypothetical protein